MAPAASHAAIATGHGSTLNAWDLDLWGAVPTPGGYLTWEGQATRLLGTRRDREVFDEGVHAIVRPPWCGLILGRGDARRWRAGPQIAWALTPRWGLRGQGLFSLSSPDRLALWPSLGGGLVLGYTWATL